MQWTVGDITITAIVEQEVLGFELIMPAATPEVVATAPWLTPCYADENGSLKGAIQAFVVETPTCRMVIDTCVGNDKNRLAMADWNQQHRPFLDRLKAAGYAPGSIDFTVCTHMHVDHVGWNTWLDNGVWKPTFPNARYLFAQKEFDFWQEQMQAPAASLADATNPAELFAAAGDADTRAAHADSVQPVIDAGLVDLVATNHAICEGVRLIPTHGHTPGHVSVAISSGGEQALITGDAIHHPVQIACPGIRTHVDVDGEHAERTRHALLRDAEAEGLLLIGTHFAAPAAGRIRQDGAAWQLIPDAGKQRGQGMSRAQSRASAVAAAIADVRGICDAQGTTRDSLEAIRQRLIALAGSELFPLEDFPQPAAGDSANSCLYRLSEDADHRYALYINSSLGTYATPVHNHTTWAVIAGISGGAEQNTFYRRSGDGGPEKIGEHSVVPGDGVAFLPEDYHAIAIDGPLLNFHLYGRALEQLDQREYYRTEEQTWAVFPPHSDIRDARAAA
jgi:glyoxylase-like metal-dependent hydrolase (beta-lactamase superfamily II)